MIIITDVCGTYVLVLIAFRVIASDIPWTHTYVLRYSFITLISLALMHHVFGPISDEYYYGLEIFSIFNAVSAYMMILQGKGYEEVDLSGKVAIVTGANAGIGLEIACQFAQMGAHVIFGMLDCICNFMQTLVACRSQERAEEAIAHVKANTNSTQLEFMQLDVASLKSVREFAAKFTRKFDRLDILANNAGVNNYYRKETVDGFEAIFGTNYLGPFLLTNLLLPLLVEADDGRIVNVGSCVMKWATKIPFDDLNSKLSYGTGQGVYNWTKWAFYLFTLELHRRYSAITLTINCAHPGLVMSNFQKNMHPVLDKIANWFNWLRPFLQQTGEQGAYTPVFAATCRNLTGGHYLARSDIEELPKKFVDEELALRLWDVACRLVDLPLDYYPLPKDNN
ncbi:short-chain dehydrogenase/reductase SDR [Thraustotheca clavata]|uniref:Short-chain dehydrogenase/reductase SDR n=1 Tax=Thraustotheca clavata TaxID=74557 RepID=A0A1W0A6L8_9STRA|nr:short-chain dehydrogenase/reductase SDR [Thraustotheca clavata]